MPITENDIKKAMVEEPKREGKLCPLPSTGRALDYIEDKCAWWDTDEQQCGMLSLVFELRTLRRDGLEVITYKGQ